VPRCTEGVRVVCVLAFVVAGCAPVGGSVVGSPFVCEPTIARMTPPAVAVEFFANGSSQPEQAREYLRTKANWFGNDAMWVVLPEQGEIVGRLDDKIAPYRIKAGEVTYEARRLDGTGAVAKTRIGPAGYGDIGFQAGGPAFPATGCWEVTYLLSGNDPLRFVVRVR
jgi:hypothetical protein